MELSAYNFPHTTSVVSRKQFDDHIKLYKGYITMINLTDKTLATDAKPDTANASGGHFRGWKKTETYSLAGVVLHELYFQNLGTAQVNNAATMPGTKTLALFNKYFGSYDAWKSDFTASAKSARGWVIFSCEQRTPSCRNIVLDTHDDGQVTTAYPLIVLDMYEHAYFIDYGTDKASYIEKFLACVPWEVIEKRVGLFG